jgi:CRP/FNR family cyclic AMP-dependent transcriptional regulator
MKSVQGSASLPLFHGELWLARLRRIVPAWTRHFPEGAVLARRGRPLQAVHVVVTGVAAFASDSRAGRRAILVLAGPGSVLGQEAVLPGAGFGNGEPAMSLLGDPEFGPMEVRAITPCTTLVFAAPQISKALAGEPLIGAWLTASLTARVAALERALGRALSLPVRDRVLDLICELAQAYGVERSGGIWVSLPLSQDDLGALIGATRESVSRALRQLTDLGFVHREQGWYVLHAPARAQAEEPGIS